MAKAAGEKLLENAFKKPSQQKTNTKEELKCEDLGIALLQWKSQIGKSNRFNIPLMSKTSEAPSSISAGNPTQAATTKEKNATIFWKAMISSSNNSTSAALVMLRDKG